jgi:hypothetical protein
MARYFKLEAHGDMVIMPPGGKLEKKSEDSSSLSTQTELHIVRPLACLSFAGCFYVVGIGTHHS